MAPFPSQGFSAASSSARLSPQTVFNAAQFKDNLPKQSTVLDTNAIPNKSITVTIVCTGMVDDFLFKFTALASDVNDPQSFAEITSEVYMGAGVYHWNIQDAGRYFRVDGQQLGTVDNLNFCTVTAVVEGTT